MESILKSNFCFLVGLGLLFLSSSVFAQLTDNTNAEYIPKEVRISPEEQRTLSLLERQFMVSELKAGSIINVFQAPPCMEGEYYIGVQLYYDLGGSIPSHSWKSQLDVSLLHNHEPLWSKSVLVASEDQSLASTVFHPYTLNCDQNFEIRIDDIRGIHEAPVDNVYLRLLLYRADNTHFDQGTRLKINTKASEKEVFISWKDGKSGSVEYDVEWVFVSEHEAQSENAVHVFSHRPTVRITTNVPYFRHSLFYPDGKIFYRVRAVGYDIQSNQRLTGDWYDHPAVNVKNLQGNTNWERKTSFLEAGDYSTVVQFSDGLGKLRQMIQRNADESTALVKEVLYDYEGAQALETYLTPVSSGALSFHEGLHQFQAQDPLISQNSGYKFHYDNGPRVNSALSIENPVRQYYEREDAFHLSSQLKANPVLKGSVSHEEIQNILGTSVPGNFSKTLQVQEDNSIEITYLNERGQEVATTWSDQSPNSQALTIDITPNRSNQFDEQTSTYALLNVLKNTTYTFSYDLSSISETEVPVEVEITILNPEGELVDLSQITGNHTKEPGKLLLRHDILKSGPKVFQVTLPEQGTYVVSKKIHLPEPSYDILSAIVLEKEAVKNTIKDIEQTFAADMSFCEHCQEQTRDGKDELMIYEEAVKAYEKNVLNQIQTDLKERHNYSSWVEIPPDTIQNHKLFPVYSWIKEHQSSLRFDMELFYTTNWEDAVEKGFHHALDKDPFFMGTGQDILHRKEMMAAKLKHILLTTVYTGEDTTAVRGNIMEIIDPYNTTFYFNAQGQHSPQGGIHPLYVDLLSQRNRLGDDQYQRLLSEKKWNLYRAYYLQEKAAIQAALSDFKSCPFYNEWLGLRDMVTADIVDNQIWQNLLRSDVTRTVLLMEWYYNTSFESEDRERLSLELEEYFKEDDGNFLHVILDSDMTIDPHLIKMQQVLHKYGANLADIAQGDRLSCFQDEMLDPYAVSGDVVSELKSGESQTTKMAQVEDAGGSDLDKTSVKVESAVTRPVPVNPFGPATYHSSHVTPDSEFQALVAFYHKTGGRDWLNQTGWKEGIHGSPVSVANWYGIITDAKGHVIAIKLEGNNLKGTLPDEIGDLTHLRYLDLGSMAKGANQITGTIPLSLGRLQELTYLDLQNNKLEGSLPSSLYRLKKLRVINLRENQLTGTLSKDVENFSMSNTIDISHNQFTGNVPTEIGKLHELKYISLSHNNFTNHIPPSIGNLMNLIKLDLSNNQLSGEIPQTIGGLRKLEYLRLHHNRLERKIPAAIGSLSSLKQLNLSENKLSGAIPSSIGNLDQIQHLLLNRNNLSGAIPSSITEMKNMKSLSLSGNQLEGDIPSSIFSQPNLVHLDLSSNRLSGEIPSSIDQATALQVLMLSNNNFIGNIPQAVKSLNKLSKIMLDHNQLSGSFPDLWEGLPQLEVLQLNHNQLSGPLPKEIGSMAFLTDLVLGSNLLTDTLPSSLGSLTHIKRLDLSHNYFVGTIPVELGQLTSLNELALNNNQLTGQVPESIKSINRLVVLNNKLEGHIPSPTEIDSQTKGSALWLSYNKYTFEDILPIKDQLSEGSLAYHRQDSVDEPTAIPMFMNHPFTLMAHIDRNTTPPSHYQWFKYVDGIKDSVMNTSAVSGHTLQLGTVTSFNQGEKYYYKITNPAIPGLTLVSHLKSIHVLPPSSLCDHFEPLETFTVAWDKAAFIKARKDEWGEKRAHQISKVISNYVHSEMAKEWAAIKERQSENIADHLTLTYTPATTLVQGRLYDEAGNIIREFSPQPISWSGKDKLHADRSFAYNSQNQLVCKEEQGDLTYLHYDAIGNLRITQDPLQRENQTYTYYKYDAQGRTHETGLLKSVEPAVSINTKIHDVQYPHQDQETLNKVLQTVYDYRNEDGFHENSRGHKVYERFIEEDSVMHEVFLSYNEQGDLSSVVYHQPGWADKRVDYVYDPITRRTKYQFYQYGQSDEFILGYQYNNHGRLTTVGSSRDGYIWHTDVHNTYHPHRTLSREERGEYPVYIFDHFRDAPIATWSSEVQTLLPTSQELPVGVSRAIYDVSGNPIATYSTRDSATFFLSAEHKTFGFLRDNASPGVMGLNHRAYLTFDEQKNSFHVYSDGAPFKDLRAKKELHKVPGSGNVYTIKSIQEENGDRALGILNLIPVNTKRVTKNNLHAVDTDRHRQY